MQITLEANPTDAPCCVKIKADDGRDHLVQTDYDWPGVASVFGWSMGSVQKPGRGYPDYYRPACHHRKTDGTVTCPECGITPGDFITAARQWLDDHDGAQADDPGYFES